MKKIFTLFAVLVIAGFFTLNSQVSGNYQYNNQQSVTSVPRGAVTAANINNNKEVTITVNGLFNVVADNYVAVFNIIQVGETLESTVQMADGRISAFKQKLKAVGVDLSKIKVDMISFVPKYEVEIEKKVFSKTYNEVPAGFELQKNVFVHYKYSAELDAIIAAAASAEIYDIVKVDYFIPNIQRSLDSLRQRCFHEVQGRVKSFEMVGLKLDTLNKVVADDFTSVYPQSRYFTYQAFARPSLTAAKKRNATPTPIESGKTVNEIQKQTSKFYQQVNYDEYDVVLNPVITEPVVQVSYTVSVKYFLEEDEQPMKNNYYILTPTGEVKQFYPG